MLKAIALSALLCAHNLVVPTAATDSSTLLARVLARGDLVFETDVLDASKNVYPLLHGSEYLEARIKDDANKDVVGQRIGALSRSARGAQVRGTFRSDVLEHSLDHRPLEPLRMIISLKQHRFFRADPREGAAILNFTEMLATLDRGERVLMVIQPENIKVWIRKVESN